MGNPQPQAAPTAPTGMQGMQGGAAGFGGAASAAAPVAPTPVAPTPVEPMPTAPAPFAPAPDMSQKKKTNTVIIMLIVACVVCLVIGIVGIVMALSSGSNSGSSNQSQNQSQSGSSADNNGGSSDNNTASVTTSGTKVGFSGYEITIPDGYEYDTATEDGIRFLYFSDDVLNYQARTSYYDDITFARVENNFDALIEGSTLDITESGDMTVGGVRFLYLVVEGAERDNLVAFSEADLYAFETEIIDVSGMTTEERLEKIAAVIGSAKKKSGSNKAFNEDGGFDDAGINNFINSLPRN